MNVVENAQVRRWLLALLSIRCTNYAYSRTGAGTIYVRTQSTSLRADCKILLVGVGALELIVVC